MYLVGRLHVRGRDVGLVAALDRAVWRDHGPAARVVYALSLHDALPISADRAGVVVVAGVGRPEVEGASGVELVRLRVRDGAVDERVRGRRQVSDQAAADGLGTRLNSSQRCTS